MEYQVCHCGWAKTTTYQGLRIHQGKMGCTPKGMRISRSEQFRFNSSYNEPSLIKPSTWTGLWQDFSTHSVKPAYYVPRETSGPVASTPAKETPSPAAGTSLQVCHCGWSKQTTYQGLRIHQGQMGCTPKGLKIPQPRDVPLKTSGPVVSTPAKEDKYRTAAVKTKESATQAGQRSAQEQPVRAPDTSLQVCHCGWSKRTTYQGLRIHQGKMGCTPKGIGIPQSQKTDAFETPQRSHKAASSARRELNFSSSAEQVYGPLQGLPMAKAQDRAKEKTREEVKDAAKPANVTLDSEWLEINHVFSEVMKVVDNIRQKALQPLEERRNALKTEAAVAIQKLQNDNDKLRNVIDRVDREPNVEVSVPDGLGASQDWESGAAVSLGTLRSLTSNMMEKIFQALDKLSPVELRRISSFAVDVKLDPDTAHRGLLLSADGKQVSGAEEDRDVPDTPERFDTLGSVLGLNRFSTGKSYWEVEVRNKTGWELGVARCNAKRKGSVSVHPDYGYWVVIHDNGNYTALSSPAVFLSLTVKPEKVGVFVDYDEGLVSFYDVTSQSHIFSFAGCVFNGEVAPYFGPHPPHDGANSDPLIITAVENIL